jgi:hypothetical protein
MGRRLLNYKQLLNFVKNKLNMYKQMHVHVHFSKFICTCTVRDPALQDFNFSLEYNKINYKYFF